MEGKYNLPERTQILSDAYKKMSDEGRDILDKVILKLEKMDSEAQKIKELALYGANINT